MSTAAPSPRVTLSAVSLRYRLYTAQSHSLRDLLASRVRRAKRAGAGDSAGGQPYQHYRTLWALKNIEAAIHDGERVGLVGPNGAGKTTLLRVMAGVYPPSHGRVEVRGHVVPLLELGLGFNPELTASENVVLASVLLGRRRREARTSIAAVMDFAELRDFADVPLKYFSSGMRARLAFSLAMETRPDVLLLDEVFAVGDIHWVRQAESRIAELMDRASVVIMASHSLGLLRRLCSRVIYLDHGQVRADGDVNDVLQAYEQQEGAATQAVVDNRAESTARLDVTTEGWKVKVRAESIPMLGECWIGLFERGADRGRYLGYQRVSPDSPLAEFHSPLDRPMEARLYRWTPEGETLEASTDLGPSEATDRPAGLGRTVLLTSLSGGRLWVRAENLDPRQQWWLGLYRPEAGRAAALGRNPVSSRAPEVEFRVRPTEPLEVRLYHRSTRGDTLAIKARVEPGPPASRPRRVAPARLLAEIHGPVVRVRAENLAHHGRSWLGLYETAEDSARPLASRPVAAETPQAEFRSGAGRWLRLRLMRRTRAGDQFEAMLDITPARVQNPAESARAGEAKT